jgi:hypothetical protein
MIASRRGGITSVILGGIDSRLDVFPSSPRSVNSKGCSVSFMLTGTVAPRCEMFSRRVYTNLSCGHGN